MNHEITSKFSLEKKRLIGFDIGSVSLNTVVMDESHNILENYYEYIHGKPFNVLKNRLASILENHPAESISGIAITGTGGKLATELIGGIFVNEIIAQATSTGSFSLMHRQSSRLVVKIPN